MSTIDYYQLSVTSLVFSAATINRLCLDRFPGVGSDVLSFDEALDCKSSMFPIEFLNSISVSGLPDHSLLLKKGAHYLMMRNCSDTLINGTRVKFLRRVGKCLELQILIGQFAGHVVLLPRFVLISKDPRFPFTLRRTQFPLASNTCC